jgi:hypothetical protein
MTKFDKRKFKSQAHKDKARRGMFASMGKQGSLSKFLKPKAKSTKLAQPHKKKPKTKPKTKPKEKPVIKVVKPKVIRKDKPIRKNATKMIDHIFDGVKDVQVYSLSNNFESKPVKDIKWLKNDYKDTRFAKMRYDYEKDEYTIHYHSNLWYRLKSDYKPNGKEGKTKKEQPIVDIKKLEQPQGISLGEFEKEVRAKDKENILTDKINNIEAKYNKLDKTDREGLEKLDKELRANVNKNLFYAYDQGRKDYPKELMKKLDDLSHNIHTDTVKAGHKKAKQEQKEMKLAGKKKVTPEQSKFLAFAHESTRTMKINSSSEKDFVQKLAKLSYNDKLDEITPKQSEWLNKIIKRQGVYYGDLTHKERVEKTKIDRETLTKQKKKEFKERQNKIETGLPIKVKKSDLNFETARNAHRGTSFVPDKRAEQEQQEYVNAMKRMNDKLKPFAKNPEQKAQLKEELERYRKNWLEKNNDLLYRRSGIFSSMIAGPSNFPTKRMQKKNEVDRKKTDEFIAWNNKVFVTVRRKLKGKTTHQEKQSSLINQTVYDIKQASIPKEKLQKDAPKGFTMGFVRTNAKNRIMGRVQTLIGNGQVEEVKSLLNAIKTTQKDQKRPVFTQRHKIWKSEEKALRIRKKQAQKQTTGQEKLKSFKGGKIIKNYEEDRIQIKLQDKASRGTPLHSSLKGSGWNYSFKNDAWQRKLTNNAEYSANQITEEHFK